MGTKKSTSSRRPRSQDDLPTPLEFLRNIVTLIDQRAFVEPPNALIERFPAGTIGSCEDVLRRLLTTDMPSDVKVIVTTVADALGHAHRAVEQLHDAAIALTERAKEKRS